MLGLTAGAGPGRGGLASIGTAGGVRLLDAARLDVLRRITSRRSNMAALPTRFLTCSPTAGSAIFQCPVPRSGKLGGTT